VVEAWSGSLKSHSGIFPRSGLPHLVDIDVPPDAGSLSLRLRSDSLQTKVELYLYDCTTGECFSYDIGFPAARSQSIVVRKPAAGRWRAAVNTAPFATVGGAFTLDEIITTGTPVRRAGGVPRRHGERWREVIDQMPAAGAAAPGRTAVVLFQLLDAAAERSEREHPWSTAPHYVTLRDRPVAIGTTVLVR
jgi:hypothetical protein